MIKKSVLVIGMFFLVIGMTYLVAVYQNNKDIEPVKEEVVRQHLEKAMAWLDDNRHTILDTNNPMLWWMLYESNKMHQDSRLESLLAEYFNRYENIQTGVWASLFGGKKITYIHENSLAGLPYYNKHFIYSLNCAENLPYDSKIIADQNSKSFCHQPSYMFRPACITHQLMGINFIRQNECKAVEDIDDVVTSLQQDIVHQLRWDIRHVDVYMQRVLMLYVTSGQDKVRPIWIKNILVNQLDDGGWDDFSAIVPVGGGKALGFGARGVKVKVPHSAFHPTAQGIYILNYLLATN